jgi:hypothetical protein
MYNMYDKQIAFKQSVLVTMPSSQELPANHQPGDSFGFALRTSRLTYQLENDFDFPMPTS